MRQDEEGNACPATLGEYRDLCNAINPECRAVEFLDGKIAGAKKGRDELVIITDYQMRMILMPLLIPDPLNGFPEIAELVHMTEE